MCSGLNHSGEQGFVVFQLSVSQDALQRCLAQLGCSLLERERRSFLFYSQFYEQILQQETQLLYQREQVRSPLNITQDKMIELMVLLI